MPPGPRQARPDDRLRIEFQTRNYASGNPRIPGSHFVRPGMTGIAAINRQVPGRDTSVSLLVMNSSRTGTPSLVFAMPRRIAGTMSSVVVMRSP